LISAWNILLYKEDIKEPEEFPSGASFKPGGSSISGTFCCFSHQGFHSLASFIFLLPQIRFFANRLKRMKIFIIIYFFIKKILIKISGIAVLC
jgi:hypothetical protein